MGQRQHVSIEYIFDKFTGDLSGFDHSHDWNGIYIEPHLVGEITPSTFEWDVLKRENRMSLQDVMQIDFSDPRIESYSDPKAMFGQLDPKPLVAFFNKFDGFFDDRINTNDPAYYRSSQFYLNGAYADMDYNYIGATPDISAIYSEMSGESRLPKMDYPVQVHFTPVLADLSIYLRGQEIFSSKAIMVNVYQYGADETFYGEYNYYFFKFIPGKTH